MKKNTEVTDNEYYILDTVDKIDKLNYKEAYLHLEIFGENYHTDPKIGFGLYIDNKAYYLPYLAACKSTKFKNFLNDRKIKKYV